MTFHINKNRNINIDFSKSNIGKTSFNSKNNYLELLRSGQITQAEYNKIINCEAFKFTETGTSSLFRLELSTNKTTSPDDVKQKTHPYATDLVMDEDGNIDLEQFSLENLKKKYPQEQYNIETHNDNNNTVYVIKDKNNNCIAQYEDSFKSSGIYEITKFDKNNNRTTYSIVELEGKIFLESISNKKNDIEIQEIFSENGNRNQTLHIDKEGNCKHIHYNFDNSSEVILEAYYTAENEFTPVWSKEYSNGTLWRETKNGKEKNYLLDDIDSNLSKLSKSNSPKHMQELKTNILKRITSYNVEEIVKSYSEENDSDLISDIASNISDPQIIEELNNHIKTLYIQNSTDKNGVGAILGEDIYSAILQKDKEALSKILKMVDSTNLRETLSWFKLTSNDNSDTTSIHSEDYNVGLMEAINETDFLSENEKDQLLTDIAKMAFEDLSESEKQIKIRDIKSHPKDFHKIEIDILRSLNINSGDLRNENNEKTYIPYNGQFDAYRKQGKTGDCWLVATVNSIIASPKGKELLESLISIDDKGNATIRLQGANKTYTFSQEEIRAKSNYSTGDADLRIVELAFDELIKEKAYENELFTPIIDKDFDFVRSIDINGNNSEFMIRQLLGDDYISERSSKNTDFNDKNKGFTLSIDEFGKGKDETYYAKDQYNNDVEIRTRHAYSIIKADEENIYITNPWDSDKILAIKRSDFNKMSLDIEEWNYSPADNKNNDPNNKILVKDKQQENDTS